MPDFRKPRSKQANKPTSRSNNQPYPKNSPSKGKPPIKKKFNPAEKPVEQVKLTEPAPTPLKPDPIVEYTPPEYVTIAHITSTFGLRGAVKAEIRTDFPERFDRLQVAYLLSADNKGEEPKLYNVLSAKVQNEKQVVIRLEGVTKIEQAELLRGYNVSVPVGEVVELPDDEYYVFQIIGLEVYSLADEYVGRVINVLNYPANDVYVVRGPLSKNDVLIPAVKDIVKKIELEEKRITVDLLEGLI
jgi:16S rRNA processing protein RimM